jgi:hypothetical protein
LTQFCPVAERCQISNDQSPRDFLSGLERVGGPFDVDEDLSSPTDPSLARVSIPRIKPGMSASGRPPGTVAGSTTTGRDWLLRLNPQHFEPVPAVFVSTTTAASPIERWLKPPEPTCSPFAPAWGEARVQRRDCLGRVVHEYVLAA